MKQAGRVMDSFTPAFRHKTSANPHDLVEVPTSDSTNPEFLTNSQLMSLISALRQRVIFDKTLGGKRSAESLVVDPCEQT